MSPSVVTANRLADGAVVYLAAEGRWTEALACARIARDPGELEHLLAAAQRAVADRLVVGVYEFPVDVGSAGPRPTRMREIIRAAGPTVHPQFGRPAARCSAAG